MIKKENQLHLNKIAVQPYEIHNEDNQQSYIKYCCPICKSLGIKTSFPKYTQNCPICNINVLWHDEEHLYKEIIRKE